MKAINAKTMKIHQFLAFFGVFFSLKNCEEIEPQIVGGQIATLGQFPHHALIAVRRLQFTDTCSGSLIRFNWVLTVSVDFNVLELFEFFINKRIIENFSSLV